MQILPHSLTRRLLKAFCFTIISLHPATNATFPLRAHSARPSLQRHGKIDHVFLGHRDVPFHQKAGFVTAVMAFRYIALMKRSLLFMEFGFQVHCKSQLCKHMFPIFGQSLWFYQNCKKRTYGVSGLIQILLLANFGNGSLKECFRHGSKREIWESAPVLHGNERKTKERADRLEA